MTPSVLPSNLKRLSRWGVMTAITTLVFFNLSFAQDRCGTVAYTDKLIQGNLILEKKEDFEKWLQEKRVKANLRQGGNNREKVSTYQIPVVVHVIHNGEPVGTGTNISDAQIISQINVLNKDYKRLNADAVNTPPDFLGVAGSIDLEFVLAQQNPEGTATNGIVRVQGTKTSWTIDDNYQLKSLSYWPAEDYLNLWVCNITDYLGYSQFPVSGLAGLENSSNNRLTDGVVIYYRSFGSSDDGSFNLDSHYDKGRTATHEIGHFLGLRHIWGDDNGACGNAGDYVADTPDQKDNTSGCPATHPRPTSFWCGSAPPMFQNYMDYTDDACMNLFTQGQVGRMITVLENSPRRESLLTSHALEGPQPVANNAGIQQVTSPTSSECGTLITPSVVVRNYGNNIVTSVRIQVSINGSTVETKDAVVNLDPSEAATITFAQRTVSTGSSSFEFQILLTNGTTDGDGFNNQVQVDVYIPEAIVAPFVETFTAFPSVWKIDNPDNIVGWEQKTAPKETTDNKAMYMNFYEYDDAEGELDILTSPSIDLSDASVAVLYFDVAYARYQSSNDGLRVYLLSDCDPNIYNGTLIYEKTGAQLETAASTSSLFTPKNSSEWRKEAINLSAFVGQQNIQLVFVALNDFGNNLYLDNVSVLVDELKDLALTRVKPDLITCYEDVKFKVTATNVGTDLISSFKVSVSIDGSSPQVSSFSGFALLSGSSLEVTLEPMTLSDGDNEALIEIIEPNEVIDSNPSDNSKTFNLVLNTTSYPVPFRENFEGSLSDWEIINPTGGLKWEVTSAQPFGKSVYVNEFINSDVGDQTWLISPTLDFSAASQASAQFYVSYARRGARQDDLKLFYSLDCGNYFEPTPIFSGDDITVKEASEGWIPVTADDWKKFVVIPSEVIGKSRVRFAFVATNDNGNNLYLDNINFTNTTEQIPYIDSGLYSIYQVSDEGPGMFQLVFNLPKRQNVRFQIIDAMGRSIADGELRDILNQPFPLDLNTYSSGVYIIRLGMENTFYSTKIAIAR